jgi:hypothetical protein
MRWRKEVLLNRARYLLVGYLLRARVSVNIDTGTIQLDVANIGYDPTISGALSCI